MNAPNHPAARTGGRSPRAAAGVLAGTLALTVVCAGYAQDAPPRPPAGARREAAAPDRVSVNFSGVDVRSVLSAIADYSRTDIVVTPGATGMVSINLRNRPRDEAIRLVAAAAGLTVLKIGDTYVVGPVMEVRKAAAELG